MPKKALTDQERKLHPSAYGGILRRRRRGRGRRTISTRYSMHLIIRAVWAYGVFSFATSENRRLINHILRKHARRTGVELLGAENAGNHLHLRTQFESRKQYCNFIRSITGEIAKKLKFKWKQMTGRKTGRFWVLRPFTSIVAGARYLANVIDYLKVNGLEGQGYTREVARFILQKARDG